MKNILVVLGLLVASQMLVAVTQEQGMELELIEPNEYSVIIPIIERIRPVFKLDKEEINIIEYNDGLWEVKMENKEKGPNPSICFSGDCGVEDKNKINHQIIKVK